MIRRVRSAILCDDFRQEDNGKGLLIGVYGKEVLVGQRPALVGFQLQMAFDVDADETDVEVRLSARSGHVSRLTLNAVRGYCTLTMALNLAITEERLLKADIRNIDGEWLEAGEWLLKFSDDAEDAPAEIAERIIAMSDQGAAAVPPLE